MMSALRRHLNLISRVEYRIFHLLETPFFSDLTVKIISHSIQAVLKNETTKKSIGTKQPFMHIYKSYLLSLEERTSFDAFTSDVFWRWMNSDLNVVLNLLCFERNLTPICLKECYECNRYKFTIALFLSFTFHDLQIEWSVLFQPYNRDKKTYANVFSLWCWLNSIENVRYQ